MPIVAQGSTSTGDLYTFSLEGFPEGILDFEPIIANALEGIEYISHIVNWKGTLDFGLSYVENDFRKGGYGSGAAYGGVGQPEDLIYEAQTGIDPNPGDIELGSIIIGEYIKDGKIFDYGRESLVSLGSSINHRVRFPHDSEINGLEVVSFQRTFIHEFVHGMGITTPEYLTYQYLLDSGAGDVAQRNLARHFATLWGREGEFDLFLGERATAIERGPVRMSGGHIRTKTKGLFDDGVLADYPYRSAERQLLSQLEIAMLEDLGWEIADRNYGDESNSLFLIEDKLWSYNDLLEREVWKDGVRYHPSEIDGVTGFFVKEPSSDQQGPGNGSRASALSNASLQSPADLTWVKKGDKRVVTVLPDLTQGEWSWWTALEKGNKRKEKKNFSKMFNKGRYPGNVGSVFVYRQKTGELYLDANYEQKGFGDTGGLIANLQPGTLVYGDILTL